MCVWCVWLSLLIQNLWYLMLTLARMITGVLVAVNFLWHFQCYCTVSSSVFDVTIVEARDWLFSTALHDKRLCVCVCVLELKDESLHFWRWLLSLVKQKVNVSFNNQVMTLCKLRKHAKIQMFSTACSKFRNQAGILVGPKNHQTVFYSCWK